MDALGQALESHVVRGGDGTFDDADFTCGHIEHKPMHMNLLACLPCTLHHWSGADIVYL